MCKVLVELETACSECHGSGARSRGRRHASARSATAAASSPSRRGLFAPSQPCPRCRGNGDRDRGSSRSSKCKRLRPRAADEALHREDPWAGAKDGTRIRLGQGRGRLRRRRGGRPLRRHVDPSPIYERRGNDLLVTVPLSFPDAALGATVEVPTPDGAVSLKVPAGRGRQAPAHPRLRRAEALRRREGRRARAPQALEVPKRLQQAAARAARGAAEEHGVFSGRIPRASGGCKAARCRVQSRPYLSVRALPASLHRLLFARQRRGQCDRKGH